MMPCSSRERERLRIGEKRIFKFQIRKRKIKKNNVCSFYSKLYEYVVVCVGVLYV
jgi:hypothetical protein